MSFDIDIGVRSERGARDRNEDCAGVAHEGASSPHGVVAALADGVSDGGGGLEAAQTTVRSVLADFPATPPTWETTVALERVIAAHNQWLAAHNRRRWDGAHSACTLTALVLRAQLWTVAQVGDSRAWLLRDGRLTPLTEDHALDDAGLQSRLTRAIGSHDQLVVDYYQGEVQPGDVFVLTSDGVHRRLRRRLAAIITTALAGGDAQALADALVDAALAAGSDDNASAIVLRVQGLAAAHLGDAQWRARQLPVPPLLRGGALIDGMTIVACVADNGVHRLYKARRGDGALVALKTLHEARAHDPQERAMLAHEAWLGRTLTRDAGGSARRGADGFGGSGGGLVRVLDAPDATAFYVLFDWHDGRTLDQLLRDGHRFEVGEIVLALHAIAKALGRLHRQRVVHRDIRPANLHLDDGGRWRLLDLGSALSGNEPPDVRSLHAGTPSYMNPEQWDEASPHRDADAMSDLFALGVTAYRWLSGRLPYGEIEPYQTRRHRRDPKPPSRLRPDVPIWLDHVVCKAVARERAQRFETAEELLLALERGAARPLSAPPATPLAVRDPAVLLQIALALSLAFNALLVVWLLFLPK